METNSILIKLKVFLINIWPTINRIINNFVSFILRVIKAGVRIALRQIKEY